MKYQSLPIAAAYRRFLALAGRLKRLLSSGHFALLPAEQQQQLLSKLRALFLRLRRVIPQRKLRQALASSALLIGLGSAQAQEFAPGQVNPFNLDLQSSEAFFLPQLVDIDGDGDFDIMGTYYAFDYDSETELFGFVFIENEGTAQMPAFGEPVLDPFGLQAEEEGYVKFPALSDLDGDGDLDIITGGGYTGEYEQANTFLEYFENTGSSTNPAFASPVVNPSGIEFGTPTYYSYPTTADLDDDGDADLLTFVYYDYESASSGFLYFENLTISGTFDLAEADNHLQLFPTVARDLLSWQYKAQDQPKQLWMEWHDAAGKPVSRQLLHGQQGTAAVQQLAAGQYTARLTDGKGQLLGLRRFIKQ